MMMSRQDAVDVIMSKALGEAQRTARETRFPKPRPWHLLADIVTWLRPELTTNEAHDLVVRFLGDRNTNQLVDQGSFFNEYGFEMPKDKDGLPIDDIDITDAGKR
jgi:hypothetical protein